jgi:Probable cobalt transporter subunit (CbtA)
VPLANLSLGAVLRAALLAGIAAGLVAAAFHFVATEAVIDAAINLEGQADHTLEESIVSRELQKGGLFLGFLIYGLTWSLLFGAVFQVAQRWLPGSTHFRRGVFLAAAAFWSVALFPFLKYPANPPGVGDPETITFRQATYLLMLALSVLGTALGVALARRRGWGLASAFLAVFSMAVYFVLPGTTDPIALPAGLVSTFRALSLVGLAVFWAALGLIFGLLLQRQDARVELRSRPSVA